MDENMKKDLTREEDVENAQIEAEAENEELDQLEQSEEPEQESKEEDENLSKSAQVMKDFKIE